jgi:hypothetical protein
MRMARIAPFTEVDLRQTSFEMGAEDGSDVNTTYCCKCPFSECQLDQSLHLPPSSFATSFPVAIHFYVHLPLRLHSVPCLNKGWADHGALALIHSRPPTLFSPTLKVRLRARTPCPPRRAAFQLGRAIVFRILMTGSYRTRASLSEGT